MKRSALLLAGVAWLAFAAPAFADDAQILQRLEAMQKALDAQQKQIEAQRKQIDDQSHEIASLRHSLAGNKTAAAPVSAPPAQVANQQQQIDALKTELDTYKTTQRLEKQDEPVWSFVNGRPLVQSPDGRFSFSLRGIGQFDAAYYDQSASASRLAAANGPSLSSGTNFRRAQIGFAGKVFGDWSYLFNYEFGGSTGNEGQGRVQSLYLQYDGLKPLAFRVGAYPPPAGIDDMTSAADTLFLERSSPAEIARSVAGGDGRDAASILYVGDKLFAALSLTGGKVADSTSYFGEQTALLGRVSDLVYSDDDLKVLVGATGTYVTKPGYTSAGPGSSHALTFSTYPELTVDDTGAKLVSTGAINAKDATLWGLEAATQWRSFYAQGGYFGYSIDRADTLSDPNFDGWYLQGSWILTGESRRYSAANGSFAAPKPSIPFSLAGGGWGAWELAARYSDLDLNYREGSAGSAVPAGGVRGGEQKIWTAGLNWYPNSLLKFMLDYQHIAVDRLGSTSSPVVNNTQVGQSINTIALRSQLAF